nr:type VI secretion system baseplate subunit TssG [uncultured Aggregatibacter sp.]
MGTKKFSAKSDLNRFGFHQLVESIAEASSINLDELENTLIGESIFHFFTNPKINFPVGDIEQLIILEEDGREVFQFLVNFLGLQGSSGPLPGSVLNEIAEEHNNNPIQSIYLDFFNHHLITVFHQIWRKYKYYIKFNPNFSDNYSRNIMNLLGVSRDFIEFTHLNWHKIFYHLGIIQSGIRTKEALTSIIQHYFDLHDISLEEHVRKIVEVEVEQKNQVGIKNVMLGENFILGDKIESFSNKFQVNINNLKLDEFHQFLPNTKKYRHLQELIRFLLKDPLPYDVLLGLHPDTKSTFILGKDNSSFLGWTTLININSGKSQSLNQIIIEGAS